MAAKIINFRNLAQLRQVSVCNFSSLGKVLCTNQPTSNVSSPGPDVTGDVPGLSDAVVKYNSEPVGPGAAKSTDYKNPEYFCYHVDSFFEAEIELLKYRLPQPSSVAPQE